MITVPPSRPTCPPGGLSTAQVLADDRLVEALRRGAVDVDHADPLVRMLARWRRWVLSDA